MSATAFQRRRRNLEEKQAGDVDFSKMKNDELKKILDEKGIEYDSKAKKEELIELIKGAE